jgi:hypothetical protein
VECFPGQTSKRFWLNAEPKLYPAMSVPTLDKLLMDLLSRSVKEALVERSAEVDQPAIRNGAILGEQAQCFADV